MSYNPVNANGQATMANSSPVVLASDQSDINIADGGNVITVDGTVSVDINAGTNAIGKLAANSGVDVGDVTINNASGVSAVNIQDGGNSITVDDGAGALTVDNAGTFAVQAAQSGTWTVQPGNTANTTAWKVDASSVAVPVTDNSGSLTVDGTVTASNTAGNIAHDGADSGNPVKIGARATNADISAVSATNDRTDLVATLTGKLINQPYSNPENFVSGAITSAMTGTTSTSLVAAPASGLRNYITTIIVSNAHATVGTDVIIQDGSGGTTLLTIPAAVAYGGAVINLPVPLRQPTTATAIYCANVTTGASTKVSAVGYKAA